MKNLDIKSIGKALALLAAGLLIGWLIFKPSDKAQTEHQHSEENMAQASTIWTCSMHPQIRQETPGDCPICGMDLVPLSEASDDIPASAVKMSETAMKLASIQTAIVGGGNQDKTIRLNGKVKVDERLIRSQSAHISGRIEQLKVNFTGDYVNRGQILAYIYSPELVTAQEELLEASRIKDSNPTLLDAARKKLAYWKLSESQIDRIISSGEVNEKFPVLANTSGYVVKKNIQEGDYVNRGQTLMQIANLSRMWVLFDIYEEDLNLIEEGDSVIYTISSIPGEKFKSTISYIDPIINSNTRVASARVEVSNPDQRLKPEMFATGIVYSRESSDSEKIIIPRSAIMWTGTRSIVYVKNSNQNEVFFRMREVELGRETGDSYEILSGLQVGEEIAVNGTFSIDAAAQLNGHPSMMNQEENPVQSPVNHSHVNMNPEQLDMDIDISKELETETKKVLEIYLDLKNSLVEDNLIKSQKEVQKLYEQLNQWEESNIEKAAINLILPMRKVLSDLEKENEVQLEDIRNAFLLLSRDMIELIRQVPVAENDLYVQHCPMANEFNGGDWLSLKTEIRNPYFGADMLTCGNVEDTLKVEK